MRTAQRGGITHGSVPGSRVPMGPRPQRTREFHVEISQKADGLRSGGIAFGSYLKKTMHYRPSSGSNAAGAEKA